MSIKHFSLNPNDKSADHGVIRGASAEPRPAQRSHKPGAFPGGPTGRARAGSGRCRPRFPSQMRPSRQHTVPITTGPAKTSHSTVLHHQYLKQLLPLSVDEYAYNSFHTQVKESKLPIKITADTKYTQLHKLK